MKDFLHPFKGDLPAGECELCGETIFAGELAYFVNDVICCCGCIESSAYIADLRDMIPQKDTDEHLFG